MKRHDHKQMLDLYEQWRASGQSKTDFAVSHGINPKIFYYWARKFEQISPATSGAGFHHISIEEKANNNQGEIMAAIQYPSGIRLELYSSFQSLNSSYVGLLKTLTE